MNSMPTPTNSGRPNRPKRPARHKSQGNTRETTTGMYNELVSTWVDDNDTRTLTIIEDMNNWEKVKLFCFYSFYHYELFKKHNGIKDNTYTFIGLPTNHLAIIMNSGVLNLHSSYKNRYKHDYDYIAQSLSIIGTLSEEQSRAVLENIIINHLDIIGNNQLINKLEQDELAALYQIYYSQYNEQLQLLMRSMAVYYNHGEVLRELLDMNENDFYKDINKELSLGVWL